MTYEKTEVTDPKKMFLIKLVNMVDSVGYLLADTTIGHVKSAMSLLASLLARIEISGKEYVDLQKLQQKMVYEYDLFVGQITTKEAHAYYYMVSQYMNKTYFREMSFIKPRIAGEGHLD